jgi:hypothetical protein
LTGPELNIPENAVLQILVLDFDTLACEETSASGFSRDGCRVQTTRHREVGKTLGLRLAGYEHMIKARIAEIADGEIIVHFEFGESGSVEKRRERRRKVSISAWVSGKNSQDGLKCEIIDASPSGCRLESHRVQVLPADIQLQIPGLDMPVAGRIVWRSTDFAGVRLIWRFASGKELEEKRIRPPNLAEKAGAKTQRQRDSSGFGVKRKH